MLRQCLVDVGSLPPAITRDLHKAFLAYAPERAFKRLVARSRRSHHPRCAGPSCRHRAGATAPPRAQLPDVGVVQRRRQTCRRRSEEQRERVGEIDEKSSSVGTVRSGCKLGVVARVWRPDMRWSRRGECCGCPVPRLFYGFDARSMASILSNSSSQKACSSRFSCCNLLSCGAAAVAFRPSGDAPGSLA